MSRVHDALALAQLDWGVIPLRPGDKRPLKPWREYQKRKLTDTEIVEQFERNPDANIGVVTGHVSNLLVLDCDEPDALKRLGRGVPVTPFAETARGQHYYFALPDATIRSTTAIADGLDVRANGGYVVAPPSVHPTGKPYEWVVPPVGEFSVKPAPAPAWLIEELRKHRKRQAPTDIASIVHGVPQGRRNDSAAALTGKLLGALDPRDWETVAWPLLCGWNRLNRPPLPESELRTVFESIASRENAKRSASDDTLQRILRVALAHSELSLREIARRSQVSKSAISRLTSPLLVSGTVRRKKPQQKLTLKRDCPRGV